MSFAYTLFFSQIRFRRIATIITWEKLLVFTVFINTVTNIPIKINVIKWPALFGLKSNVKMCVQINR